MLIAQSMSSQKNTVAIYTEIDLYMTLIYLVLESQRHSCVSESSQKFKQEFGKVDISGCVVGGAKRKRCISDIRAKPD